MLSLVTVARAQFRLALAYMMVRKSLIAVVITVSLTGLFAIADGFPAIRINRPQDMPQNEPQVSVMFVGSAFGELATGMVGLSTAFLMVCLYGFMSAFRVWRDTLPRERGYHWTMPVERSRHDLIRVAAGGALLMIVVLILASVALLGMVIGGHSGTLQLVPAGFWMGFAGAPLLLYLMSTMAVLRSNRPAMPILTALGILYGLFILTLFPTGGAAFWLIRQLVVGPYSLTVAIIGPVLEMIQKGLSAEPARQLSESGLNTDAWPAAFTLWFALALAGVIVAACIRPRKT